MATPESSIPVMPLQNQVREVSSAVCRVSKPSFLQKNWMETHLIDGGGHGGFDGRKQGKGSGLVARPGERGREGSWLCSRVCWSLCEHPGLLESWVSLVLGRPPLYWSLCCLRKKEEEGVKAGSGDWPASTGWRRGRTTAGLTLSGRHGRGAPEAAGRWTLLLLSF